MDNNDLEPEESPTRSGLGMKMAIAAALVFAVGVTLYVKGPKAVPAPTQTAVATPLTGRPKLVDLGATQCIPCKMMAPILEELKQTYAGKLDVVFVDVWEKPDEAKKYSINLIPTQVFYDASGKERFRHEGFFAKEDILAKWKELGVDLPAPPPAKGP